MAFEKYKPRGLFSEFYGIFISEVPFLIPWQADSSAFFVDSLYNADSALRQTFSQKCLFQCYPIKEC